MVYTASIEEDTAVGRVKVIDHKGVMGQQNIVSHTIQIYIHTLNTHTHSLPLDRLGNDMPMEWICVIELV